jgi:hypothetical protein
MYVDYYENGFFDSNVCENIKKRLWNEIYTTEWRKDTEENIYKEIPIWYKSNKKYKLNSDGSNRSDYERQIGNDIFKNTPKSLIEIGNDLVHTQPFLFFKNYYKQHILKYIDFWNGSEEIDYHYDTINGCDTLVLIYLTEQQTWKQEWGGSFSMKKQVYDNIVFEKKYFPENGKMLVINNSNPLIYHKVEKLKNFSVNRYTFSFIYKWS